VKWEAKVSKFDISAQHAEVFSAKTFLPHLAHYSSFNK